MSQLIPIEQWAAEMVRTSVPFVEHGRDRSGVDCWGLAILNGRECFGKEYPDYANDYVTVKDFDHMKGVFESHLPEWQEVPIGEEVPGDIVLLRLRGRPIHVGVVVSRGTMIHIEENIDVCLEVYSEGVWKHRVLGFYRPRGE